MHSKKIKADQKGFSVMELMIVMATIGIIASLSIAYFIDFLRTARDTTAMNDAQNMMMTIYGNFMSRDSVDYTATELTGHSLAIGTLNTDGDSRNPVYKLSPDVRIYFDPADANKSYQDGSPGSFHAWIYHTGGNVDTLEFCEGTGGRRCMECFVDEGDNLTELIIW